MSHEKSAKGRGIRFLTELGIPSEAFASGEGIYICGDREITVTGCDGVIEYESALIILRMKHRVLYIRGEGLSMQSFYTGEIAIRGRLSEISFGDDVNP